MTHLVQMCDSFETSHAGELRSSAITYVLEYPERAAQGKG